jgi:hypothetical protein
MTPSRFPNWLDWFSLTISDEHENGLFNQDDYDVKDLLFPKIGLCAIDDVIFIKEKKYIVINIIIRNDIHELRHKESNPKYYIQLEIIVSDKVGL